MKSVIKVFQILELLAGQTNPVALGEISHALVVNKSTTRRFLVTLMKLGYVAQDKASRQYRITNKLANLVRNAPRDPSLPTIAKPYLDFLANETGETINLGVLNGADVLFIDQRESQQRLRLCVDVGGVAPFHATALGKAIAAFMPEEEFKQRFGWGGPLPRCTEKTIVTWAELETELERVRKEGIAWDDEEHMDGGICVGAPIFRDAQVVASISISSPASRMTEQRKELFKKLVIDQTQKLSLELSHAV
jgi:DNA-binding IclR family transcriptional regulator